MLKRIFNIKWFNMTKEMIFMWMMIFIIGSIYTFNHKDRFESKVIYFQKTNKTIQK